MSVSKRDSGTAGLLLHRAFTYDFVVWLFTRGGERTFRNKLLELARVEPGESVLDVGCGTGTLAVAARRRVGPSGIVCGIDASPQMVARATTKARKAGVDVAFSRAFAQTLPFPAGRFDVVLSTVMLHHLPRPARQQSLNEMRRVLKPQGRVLAVDFASSGDTGSGYIGRLLAHVHHRRHGHVDPTDLLTLFRDARFDIIESGAVGVGNLHFVLGSPAA